MMEGSEERGTVMVTELETVGRRNVRRKLVQSTLFPHQSEAEVEPSGDRMCNDGNKEGSGDGEDEGLCGSQGKRTRKQKTKATPKNGASKKLAKEKSPRKSTPKKNANRNGSVAANQIAAHKVSPQVTNLRLEAKLKAEEDSRMSAGKPIHPFFSLWKAGKKNQEAAEAESNGCRGLRRSDISTLGPIHVYEKCQGEDLSIDWKNWTFCEETSTSRNYDRGAISKESSISSHPDASIMEIEERDQIFSQSQDKEKKAEMDHEVHEVVFLSSHDDGVEEFCNDSQSCDFTGQPRNRLWIDKYQPRRAMEVCGNNESVKLMNDWLCLWRERGFQSTKDSGNEGKSRDDDYGSDSDADSTDIDDCLKNVLLIIGPVGSGKSAAIHACAKEQGFKILESNASEWRSGAIVKQKFGEALESYGLTRSLESSLNSSQEHVLIEVTATLDSESQAYSDRANLKPLILFEDVDTCFPEDRGLVSAIQQIAEKAKGPVVLTTNEINHGLPDNMDRVETCFVMPHTKELLSHLSMICEAENVNVHQSSLEKLVRSCRGDLRKAIMHLQFWFQSKRNRDTNASNRGDPVLFDLEAVHMLLPRILPLAFPSQLSQFVETEIAKSLSMADEDLNSVQVFVGEVENEEMINKFWRFDSEKEDSLRAKKAAMLRRNSSYEDFLNIHSHDYSPNRSLHNTVLSSEDEPLNQTEVSISTCLRDKETLLPNCYLSETSRLSSLHVSQSVDVSIVPESSFVPETQIYTEAESSPRAVSSGYFNGKAEFSQIPSSNDRFRIDSNCTRNAFEVTAESYEEMEVEACVGEYQVRDECSRIDFSKMTKNNVHKLDFDPKKDSVQECWRKLRSNHVDLKPYLDSEPIESPQVLDLTFQISNILSEAELHRSKCQKLEAMEAAMEASEEVDMIGLCDELEEMTSIVAHRSFCYYAKEIAATVSASDSMTAEEEFKFDDAMAMAGRSIEEEAKDKGLMQRERKRRLLETMRSIVPQKSYLALKGKGFHEYASYIGRISTSSEATLLKSNYRGGRRRSRGERHYLSRGAMMLSPDDIAFVGQLSTFNNPLSASASL